ncbi:VanW family protein [Streptomyces sodiiphilus]|uniref:VanW family protein n=1 Tax=Streptomyces sodiiphilus TaxID=226217 RepID=A0ABP5A1C9_9ACTN
MSNVPPPPAEPPRISRGGLRERLAQLPRPALVGGAVAIALGGTYLTGQLVVGSTIAPGTSVHGVDIGGLTPQAARETLDRELAGARTAPVPVILGGAEDEVHTVDPVAAGLDLDIPATVDRADRPGLLGKLFGSGGGEIAPVVLVDEKKARAELDALSEESASTVQEGAISFAGGEIEVTEPRAGTALDVDGALDGLREGYPAAADPVRLPVTEAEPRTDDAEVRRALNEFARPAVSGPVVLTANGKEIFIAPEIFGDHLTMTPDDEGRLVPELDGEGLAGDERLAGPVAEAEVRATEARLRLEGDEVVVAAGGEPGSRVVKDAIGDAVMPLLTGTGAARTGPVETETVEPKVSRENYRELGITEKMSSFTVSFDPAPYRTTNIGRAVELINGSVVLPGEEWSFNRTVGERTKENGFVEGIIILDDRYQNAQGGGVSAVATTMFNAVFFAGVKPVEYRPHSFYIERYPEGREATVAWGSLDLRWHNDSGNAIYVMASSTDNSVTITFLGTKVYDKVESVTGPRTNVKEPGTREAKGDKCVPQPPLEGFDVEVERVLTSGGKEVGREAFTTRYTPRDEVVCEDDD